MRGQHSSTRQIRSPGGDFEPIPSAIIFRLVECSTLDELDELASTVFPGYYPHYHLAYAQCLLACGDENQPGLAAELIGKARGSRAEHKNPCVARAAEHLELQLAHKR
jgi:hypothetical protein